MLRESEMNPLDMLRDLKIHRCSALHRHEGSILIWKRRQCSPASPAQISKDMQGPINAWRIPALFTLLVSCPDSIPPIGSDSFSFALFYA